MKLPSIPALAGISIAVVLWLVYVVLQITAYSSISKLRVVTAEEFRQERPTKGWYRVTGGRMGYERVEGGDFFEGGTVMRTASYRSYLPLMDMKTNELVLLIEIIGQDANPKIWREKVLPPGAKPVAEDVEGTLYPAEDMDAGVLEQFSDRGFAIPAGTPVLRLFDNPQSGPMVRRIVLATILMLAAVALPFILDFLSGRQKPQKRRPDKFVPSWRR